jgi:hypothetical protein
MPTLHVNSTRAEPPSPEAYPSSGFNVAPSLQGGIFPFWSAAACRRFALSAEMQNQNVARQVVADIDATFP